jgi:hypothetical protein
MLIEERNHDAAIEAFIECARARMCLADTVDEQRAWWNRMLYWHRQRSKRQIRAMELSQKLIP